MSRAEHPSKPPYKSLGLCLRNMRQKVNESLPEVSGAVEIDSQMMERIEQGYELPSEDILMLLISHFGVQDDKAVELWELAGYEKDDRKTSKNHDANDAFKQQLLMIFALDAHVVYTNGLEINNDAAGLVMSFTQTVDDTQPAVPIAKVGMSYEQAEKVSIELQKSLLRAKYLSGPKALISPDPLPHPKPLPSPEPLPKPKPLPSPKPLPTKEDEE